VFYAPGGQLEIQGFNVFPDIYLVSLYIIHLDVHHTIYGATTKEVAVKLRLYRITLFDFNEFRLV